MATSLLYVAGTAWLLEGVASSKICNGHHNCITVATAPSWRGPYSYHDEYSIPVSCEDPMVWRTPRGGFQFLCHEMGHGNNDTVGRMAFSEDGLSWTLSPVGAYTLSAEYSDGSSAYFCRRERPKLLLDIEGRPTHLFTGVLATKETCGGFVDPESCPGHNDDGSCGCQYSWTHAQPLGGGGGGAACTSEAECFGGGACLDGTCHCDEWWSGEACQSLSLLPGAPPSRQAYRRWDEQVASWGGSPIRAEDGFHLFVSEFADQCGLSSWMPKSTVVHATSTTPEGPYERQETILGMFHHNPAVVSTPAGYLLMAIGQVGEANITHSSQFHIHAAEAPSIAGPWDFMELDSLRNGSTAPSNMHPYVFPNGSVLLVLRRNPGDGLQLV